MLQWRKQCVSCSGAVSPTDTSTRTQTHLESRNDVGPVNVETANDNEVLHVHNGNLYTTYTANSRLRDQPACNQETWARTRHHGYHMQTSIWQRKGRLRIACSRACFRRMGTIVCNARQARQPGPHKQQARTLSTSAADTSACSPMPSLRLVHAEYRTSAALPSTPAGGNPWINSVHELSSTGASQFQYDAQQNSHCKTGTGSSLCRFQVKLRLTQRHERRGGGHGQALGAVQI